MSQNSAIEWTEATWNPVTGCTKISDGCLNCYAARMTRRLKAMGSANYKNGFNLTVHRDSLRLPLKWKKPQLIFVNSMSDLFHKDVPDSFIFAMFKVMREAHWHKFQILTKRSERLLHMSKQLPWADNILMGVTVENEKYLYRLEHLKKTREEFEKELEKEAEFRVIIGLILSQIAKDNNLKVEDKEIEEEIKRITDTFQNDKKEEVQTNYSSKEGKRSVENALLAKKAVEEIKKKVSIK